MKSTHTTSMKTQSYRRVGTSKKRAKELREYRKRKKAFLEANSTCFVCRWWTAPKDRDLHHLRGRIHSLLNDERFWRLCCRSCHDWIHTHSKEATKDGFLAGPGEWNKVPR